MNLARLMEDNLVRFGEYDFIHFQDEWYSNFEMNRRTNRLGCALKRLGVGKGDRVGVQLANSPELIQSFFAVLKIGAVLVPINPSLKAADLAHIYEDSGIKALIARGDSPGSIREARRAAPALEWLILTERDVEAPALSLAEITRFVPDELVIADTENDDLAVILYTAGTTGRAKGVMLSHYSLYTHVTGYYELVLLDIRGVSLRGSSEEFEVRQGRRVAREIEVFGIRRPRLSLIALPLFHGYGIFAVNLEFLTGGKLIILGRWDALEAMQAIEQLGITDFRGVPTMYIQILNHPRADRYNLSSLQTCICGSAPLPLEVARNWKERYGLDIWEGYGLSEAATVNCGNVAGGRPPKYGSIGLCYQKANSIRIFDSDGLEVPRGQTGEIVIKGPGVMLGYWNNPKETARVLKDGWLHTGDLGHMDEDGYIYLTERKKDLIIRGGENVYPKEVENVLHEHPQVLEAGVIGIPDLIYGEEVAAFVALKTPGAAAEEELLAFCKERLPTYKRPKSIKIMESLPKSAVGKILRRELRGLAV